MSHIPLPSLPPLTPSNPRSPGDVFCFDSAAEQDAFFAGTLEDTGIEYAGNFTDPADVAALLARAPSTQQLYEELGRRCEAHASGKYLRYVGSAATARDMAAMADALEGPGSLVNYLGTSYGTLIGSWFVNSEFPHC